jgi:hypothetical protein
MKELSLNILDVAENGIKAGRGPDRNSDYGRGQHFTR